MDHNPRTYTNYRVDINHFLSIKQHTPTMFARLRQGGVASTTPLILSADASAHHFELFIDCNLTEWNVALAWIRANSHALPPPHQNVDEHAPFGGILGIDEKLPEWAKFYGLAGTGRKVAGICTVWRKRMQANGFVAGKKLGVAVLAKSMILPCVLCAPDRGDGRTCWGVSMGGTVVPRVWYAKNGIKFDVSNADEDDNMRCACDSGAKAEFVEEAKGCLILLTPCAVQRGGSGYTTDKLNTFELEVEWRKGPHWATLADERVISACVPDDWGGKIGARIVSQADLTRNVCRAIFADKPFNRKVFLPLVKHHCTLRKKDSPNCFDVVTGELDDGGAKECELEFGPLKRNIEGNMATICYDLTEQESNELVVSKACLRDTMSAMLSWHHLLSPNTVCGEDKITYVLDYSEFGHGEHSLSRTFFSRFAEGVLHALKQCEEITQARNSP